MGWFNHQPGYLEPQKTSHAGKKTHTEAEQIWLDLYGLYGYPGIPKTINLMALN